MSKFNVGDKVHPDGDSSTIKTIAAVEERRGGTVYRLKYPDGHVGDAIWFTSELILVEKRKRTWDTLEHGDMLLADFGDITKEEHKVIEVFPRSVIVQKIDSFYTHHPSIRTIADLKQSKHIWSIKGTEEPEKLTELTLDEIAKKFKVDVSKLRIKE